MRQQTRIYLSAGAGGALGSVARWGTSLATLNLFGSGIPWGTLTANTIGSFIIGLYFTLTESDGRVLASPVARQFVLAGFCGGFTTFSVFSLETVLLFRNGNCGQALTWTVASMALWLVAVWFGHGIGLRINRLRWRRQ